MEQIIFFLLFGMSLLNVFLRFFTEYSQRFLWVTSVATSEYGVFFAFLAFLFWFAVLVFGSDKYSRWSRSRRWMVPLTMLLFLYPTISGIVLETGWRAGMAKAFGASEATTRSWIRYSELLVFRDAQVPNEYKTFPYQVAKNGERTLTLDYYPGRENAPLFLVIHGGGWSAGDSQQLPELNRILMKTGYHVASVSYSFIPAKIWPAQKNDVVEAINWLRRNTASLKFDPNKIILLGRSAGGQIAGVIANQRRDLGIVGLISYYAPTDLSFGFDVADENDIIDSRDLLRQLHNGDPLQNPEPYLDTSVLRAVSPLSPPTLILHGKSDSLCWHKHSERWARVLEAAKVKHYYLRLPWATHGFDFNIHGPGGQIATNAVLHFSAQLAPVPVEIKK